MQPQFDEPRFDQPDKKQLHAAKKRKEWRMILRIMNYEL